MIRAVAFSLLLSGSGVAAQESWPDLFDVKGVAANDVLNVRNTPSTNAGIIGALRADTKNIEVIETDFSMRWGRINIDDGTGWVSLTYLHRQSSDETGAMPAIRTCHGTEPFWSLSLDGTGNVHFTTPDAEPQTGAVALHQTSLNRPDRHAFSAQLSDISIIALVARSLCGDGMSDRAYGLSIDLLLNDSGADPRLLSGCCSLLP